MTRKQQIEGIARRRNPYSGGTKGDISSALMAEFIAGAEWADLTMINKACEWLAKNVNTYLYSTWNDSLRCSGKMLDDFKKAMEG